MSDLNLTMFRAYDIRTPSANLTDGLAIRLARAEAAYFHEIGAKGVVLAHDARLSGPRYLELCACELSRSGLPVYAIPGACSTSALYFAAMQRADCAAIMVGASHNPAGDTGQKILAPGVIPVAQAIGPLGGLDRIKELYTAEYEPPAASQCAKVEGIDPFTDYIRHSMKLAGVEPGRLRGLRLMHDYLNGAAGREMMRAFALASADLTPLHFTADGRFPLGDPNPVKQTVVQQGMGFLVSGDFVLGTFFDGDGDRIDFYRGDGSYLASSFIYAAILPSIVGRFADRPLMAYADLKSNPLAVIQMTNAGVGVSVIRNGHSQIKNALIENTSYIGAVEESAHFYESFAYEGSRYCTENTLYIALLTARIWFEEPERFATLLELQRQTCREREWGYKFPTDSQRAAALEAVQKHFEMGGAIAMNRMPNGYDLEATMMRRGLPFDIDGSTQLDKNWLQVCQRISQSENGLARWEVVALDVETARQARKDIASIVKTYGAGDDYQG